jgi:high-affinity K+ transport system ATPase subunit B|tara:strand:- start:427 stop:687 length:261 start_codon:yes stop_codon:yes gene_type:complete
MRNKTNLQSGLIELVLVIIIAVVLLSLFGVNLSKITESEMLKENLTYIQGLISPVWNNYIAPALTLLQEKFIDPYIVSPLANFFTP